MQILLNILDQRLTWVGGTYPVVAAGDALRVLFYFIQVIPCLATAVLCGYEVQVALNQDSWKTEER